MVSLFISYPYCGYCPPDGVVTMHYADIGYWGGSPRLGRTDDLAVIKGQKGSFTVTIERAGTEIQSNPHASGVQHE